MNSMARTLAVIPARGKSKTIPRKNLVEVGGKPLIAHMIGHALQVEEITDLVVSTEDDEIAAVAERFGAKVPFRRPAELADDNAPSLPAVQHATREMERLTGQRYDYVVMLQATAPLCRPQDIEACLQRLAKGDCQSVVTVIRVMAHHPFRMKRIINGDILINFIEQGFEDMGPRQGLPPVYKRSGAVYASTCATLMDDGTLVGADARAVLVPEETGLEIDTPLDLALVRLAFEGSIGNL